MLALLANALPACAGSEEPNGDAVESQNSDVKKKIQPTGGDGSFELTPPSFPIADFAVPTFTFDGLTIKPAERIQRAPGKYPLALGGAAFADGQLMGQTRSVQISYGETSRVELSGLRIRFAEPVTLGSARVDFSMVTVPTDRVTSAGFLKSDGGWVTSATGASMLAFQGMLTMTSSAERSENIYEGNRYIDLAPGQLKEVVLPTSRVRVLLDAYDPAYPTAPATAWTIQRCVAPTLRAGARSEWVGSNGFDNSTAVNVRNADGSPNGGEWIVPQGRSAPVTLGGYGFESRWNPTAGGEWTFTLNRLEVDDMKISQPDGGSKMVKGIFSISRKGKDGRFDVPICEFPTHSGLDLPDGTYRVITWTDDYTSTNEITFP